MIAGLGCYVCWLLQLGMKARVELAIRDEEGKILGQLDSYSMELGAQSLYEIEGSSRKLETKSAARYDGRVTTQCSDSIHPRVKKTEN